MPQPRRRRIPNFGPVRRDSGIGWWVFGGPILKSPISVTRALDDWVKLNEDAREPDGMYHPSSLWNCLRQTIYGVRGEPVTNPPDAQSLRTFWIGHMIHSGVQAALSVSPDLVAFYPEFRILIPSLNITGHGDGLLLLRSPDGKVAVLEVKSAKASAFRFGKKEGHVLQASTYSVAVRDEGVWVTDPETSEEVFLEPFGENMIGILLVYLNKEDASTMEFFIPYDEIEVDGEDKVVPGSWAARLEERIGEAEPYRLDPESLPPRLPKVKGKLPWQCNPRWCPVFDKCMSEPARGREPASERVEVEPW